MALGTQSDSPFAIGLRGGGGLVKQCLSKAQKFSNKRSASASSPAAHGLWVNWPSHFTRPASNIRSKLSDVVQISLGESLQLATQKPPWHDSKNLCHYIVGGNPTRLIIGWQRMHLKSPDSDWQLPNMPADSSHLGRCEMHDPGNWETRSLRRRNK
jgi:hypothetical protein